MWYDLFLSLHLIWINSQSNNTQSDSMDTSGLADKLVAYNLVDYSAFQTFRQSVLLRFIRKLLLFLFKSLCIQQDKTTRHLGIIFLKFSTKVFLIFSDKTHESMGLYNGKTTTTMPLLCSDPDSVDGETSGFGTASNHD